MIKAALVEVMEVEYRELTAKVDALAGFIESSPTFGTLSAEERDDMVAQRASMRDYQAALKNRIRRAGGL